MNSIPQQGQDAASLIAALARRASEQTVKPVSGAYADAAPFIVLLDSDGKERIEWLRERLTNPSRKTGTVSLHDARSFIEFFKIHGRAGAPIFATLQPAQFVAILNDHTKESADWRDHRAVFKPAYSREWETWTKHNGKGSAFNSNESFAVFLEDNAPDIVRPDAATMMNIALNFRVKSDVQFSIAQRLEDGQVELGYNNVVSGSAQSSTGGKLKIPEQFQIRVPVWDGLDARTYGVDARFRYRLSEGKLTIWYELVRPHKVVEQAFKDVWDQVQKDTKTTILHGRPD